jgi:tRNA threonylcarbamoyl adenosine modification protein YjeE
MDVETRSLLKGPGETLAFGRRLGALLEAGDWVALCGDLGAGKTTLVQGVVEGIHPGIKSRSPTYVLVEVYGTAPAVVHADLYRLETESEWDTLGIEDLASDGAVVLIEWADKAAARLPEARLDLTLRMSGEGAREISVRPRGERFTAWVRDGLLDREYWSGALHPRD